ncbi:phosphopantetheine-binding protein, partial [Streptomyces sp. MCAF7]
FDAVLIPADGTGEAHTHTYNPSVPPRALTNTPANSHATTRIAGTARDHLSTLLPQHLIPAAIIPITEIPLTDNGKINHRALPAPRPTRFTEGRPPRTPHEEILCTLYAETLGHPHVTIDDSFFDLGGHSLLATKLVDGIRAT